MRKEKQLLLDEVSHQIANVDSFVLVSYKGLTANNANNFRRQICKIGGNFEVVRKRVLQKAAKTQGIDLDLKSLPGHIGLVFCGQDAIETTKAVFRINNEIGKTVDVIGGRFDGLLYDGSQVEMLSKLPGKDEMRAQLLATLEAPMSQTLAVMDALLSSVVHCLNNKSKSEDSNN